MPGELIMTLIVPKRKSGGSKSGVGDTEWKLFKFGVFSVPYFLVFSPNAGKYGPEKTPYLDNLHAVWHWHA